MNFSIREKGIENALWVKLRPEYAQKSTAHSLGISTPDDFGNIIFGNLVFQFGITECLGFLFLDNKENRLYSHLCYAWMAVLV